MNLGIRKTSVCFHSYQNNLEFLCFAPTSSSTPPSPAPCTALRAHRSPLLHIPLPVHPPAHPSASRPLCLGICSCRTSLARSRLFHLLLLPSAGLWQREGWRPGKCPLPLSLLFCALLSFPSAIPGDFRGPFGVPASLRPVHTSWRGSSFPRLTDMASLAPLGDRTCVTVARH